MTPADDSREYQNPYAAPALTVDEPTAFRRPHVNLGPFQPFKTIWMHPRITVQQLVARDPTLHVLLLVGLAGIGETLDRASMRNVGDRLPLSAILLIAVTLGPLGGLLGLWIGSHLIRLTGSWIGGTAPRSHVRTAMAWANVPAVFALPLWIPLLLLFGSEMFTYETPRLDAQPILLVPFIGIGLIGVVLGIWGIVLLCNTVAEVQGFHSAWKGLGNLILAALVLVVPLIMLGVFLAFLMMRM